MWLKLLNAKYAVLGGTALLALSIGIGSKYVLGPDNPIEEKAEDIIENIIDETIPFLPEIYKPYYSLDLSPLSDEEWISLDELDEENLQVSDSEIEALSEAAILRSIHSQQEENSAGNTPTSG